MLHEELAQPLALAQARQDRVLLAVRAPGEVDRSGRHAQARRLVGLHDRHVGGEQDPLEPLAELLGGRGADLQVDLPTLGLGEALWSVEEDSVRASGLQARLLHAELGEARGAEGIDRGPDRGRRLLRHHYIATAVGLEPVLQAAG